MFQNSVSKNLSLRIETNQHLQITSKTICSALYSCPQWFTILISTVMNGED